MFQPAMHIDNSDMFAIAPPPGLDLLTRMATVAAVKADAQLPHGCRLSACEALELRDASVAEDVALECWTVRRSDHAVTVSVFATAHHAAGGACMAASGRFTFTQLSPLTKDEPS